MTEREAGETTTIVAFVPDLIDRSRISAAAGANPLTYAGSPGELAESEADLYVADLSRPGVLDVIPALAGRIVCFGSHVDRATLAAARSSGGEVHTRSEFFSRLEDLLDRR